MESVVVRLEKWIAAEEERKQIEGDFQSHTSVALLPTHKLQFPPRLASGTVTAKASDLHLVRGEEEIRSRGLRWDLDDVLLCERRSWSWDKFSDANEVDGFWARLTMSWWLSCAQLWGFFCFWR